MSRIKVLDDSLISKIAAGEVIERPASVIKELIENSIDAGARNITIEVKEAGKKYIKVIDDGSGMDPEEAKLSIERHSTSKITDADDLFNIKTLGFRGEALPSIASVSKFELVTSDGKTATKIEVEGAKFKGQSKAGHPQGTSISVSELFFNTPARLKFQKSRSTEMSHIIDIVSRFIMGRPDISFKLISEKEETLRSLGSGKLIDAIASVYGLDMARSMIEVRSDREGISVQGYVTQPVISKSDRYAETFFVNGRYVRNILLSKALEDAFRNLIPYGKYPISVLSVELDPKDIDVNVHPTKREVKFAKADSVIRSVNSAVSSSLSGIARSQNYASPSQWTVGEQNSGGERLVISDEPTFNTGSSVALQQAGAATCNVLQHLLTYIIYTDGSDLVMIDQHAAHERIMYERIIKGEVSGIQEMLLPKSIELEAAVYEKLAGSIEEIKSLGFIVEVFGKNTVIVRGVPAVLRHDEIDRSLDEILSELGDVLKVRSVDDKKDAIAKMLACRSAIKAGDRLSVQEMNSLIKELGGTSNPSTCPHGRPTMVRMQLNELEKSFKRK